MGLFGLRDPPSAGHRAPLVARPDHESYCRNFTQDLPGLLSREISRHHDQVIDHYRALFRQHSWLTDSLCWTVVQPLDEGIALDDLLWRLNSGRDPEERVMDDPMEVAMDEDLALLYVFEGDGAYGFLEGRFGDSLPDELLAALSEDARVWTTSWGFNRTSTIAYAGGGRIRARIDNYVRGQQIDDVPEIFADFPVMLDGLDREDLVGRQSAAFAFIEMATGVGVEGDRLDGEGCRVIVLDTPALWP
ncbi:hypothetical protein [Nonomuraea maritima]|uniref:hypothetical protein n=1 Tax=Nonomuraea maritima TaxID=683260 RepID=UPI001C40A00F|nr:hypothetical protein [Nonomuraea maritima]